MAFRDRNDSSGGQARTRTGNDVWNAALGSLQLEVSKANFRTWLAQTQCSSYENNKMVISAPNTFVAEYLGRNMVGLVSKTLASISGSNVDVEFVVDSSPKGAVRSAAALNMPIAANHLNLNRNYTFETFAKGSGSEAYEVAKHVSEHLGNLNPLYIYGSTGLGKTHLLNAVGNAAADSGKTVVYATAESFMNEFTMSLKDKTTDEFRNKYRRADVLLLDDIAFLFTGSKTATKDALFHIINEMLFSGRQVVLASDRPHYALPAIDDPMLSRFKQGEIIMMHPPDLEARKAIITAKTLKDGVALSSEAIGIIAAAPRQDVRELEGLLHRLARHISQLKEEATPEFVKKTLSYLTKSNDKKPLEVSSIINTVAIHFEIDVEKIKNGDRSAEVVEARWMAMYLFREHTDFSLREIGRMFGGRSPATISHGLDEIAMRFADSPSLRQKAADIEEKLGMNKHEAADLNASTKGAVRN